MKANLSCALVLSGGVLLCSSSALAAESSITGQACWTGKVNSLGVSPKDAGWTWQNTGTYVDGNDQADNLYYQCVGMGGVVAGERQTTSWYCVGHAPDGSSVLWQGEEGDGGTSKGKIPIRYRSIQRHFWAIDRRRGNPNWQSAARQLRCLP